MEGDGAEMSAAIRARGASVVLLLFVASGFGLVVAYRSDQPVRVRCLLPYWNSFAIAAAALVLFAVYLLVLRRPRASAIVWATISLVFAIWLWSGLAVLACSFMAG